MNEGIPRSLYAPRLNWKAGGGLSVGKGRLPHAATAKSMAKSFSGTSPWNTEVWCFPYKHDGAHREHKAKTRRMAVCQETRLKNPKTFFRIRKPYASNKGKMGVTRTDREKLVGHPRSEPIKPGCGRGGGEAPCSYEQG